MTFSLDGGAVVITGGAGRIGRTFCEAVAQHGGIAVVADTAAAAAEATAERLRAKFGPKAAIAVPFDITDAESIDAAIAKVGERCGRIDALVNNAYPRNARWGAPFEKVTYGDFCDNVSMHLGGYFLTSQRFCLRFVEQRRGAIVNMASIYGVVAPRFEVYAGTAMTMPVEYAAIKAGVLHLTSYMAQYLKPHGVRVNAISPGGVFADQASEFVARYAAHAAGGKMLKAEDLAGALIYLLSPAGAHVTGQNLIIDDGWTL
jgi:NAD(P)-dependent dehydrogenase (short-subunit alcohol dehydrogenase family)